MRTHPIVALPRAVFRALPTPVLLLASMFLTGFLLMPDFIPLLDELVLGTLLFGAVGVLLERRGGAAAGVSAEPAPAGSLLRGLVGEVRGLRKQAAALRAQGVPVAALDHLAAVQQEAERLVDAVKRADAYLSRRENDPWQVQREVRRLEEAEVAAEIEGSAARRAELLGALRAARAHADSVRDESAGRDAAVGASRALTTQVRALHEVLRVVSETGAVPELPVRLGAGWTPPLQAVVDGLREARAAEQEMASPSGPPAGRTAPSQRA